jgi:hypothetical protein
MPTFMNGISLNIDNIENDEAINIFFEENGFQSKQFLKNTGSTLIFLVFYILGWVFLFIVSRIAGTW